MSTKRQPKGIPVGGQFAANNHDEASAGLGAPPVPRALLDVPHTDPVQDDMTPPGHYVVTAKALGVTSAYYLDQSGEIVGRTEYGDRGQTHYAGGNVKGGSIVPYPENIFPVPDPSSPMRIGESREAIRSDFVPKSIDEIDIHDSHLRSSLLIGKDRISARVTRLADSKRGSEVYSYEVQGPGGTETVLRYFQSSPGTPNIDDVVGDLAEAAWRQDVDAYDGYEDEEELAEDREQDAKDAATLRKITGESFDSYASASGVERRSVDEGWS